MKNYIKVLFYRICGLLLLIKRAALSGTPFAPNTIKKILICETALLGDVVCAHPLIDLVADRFPHAEIALAVQAPFKAVVTDNPKISKIFFLVNTRFSGICQLVVRLWRERFDLLIASSPGLRNAIISLTASLAACRSVVTGYLTNASLTPRFYQDHAIEASIASYTYVTVHSPDKYPGTASGIFKYGKNEHLTLRSQKAILPIIAFAGVRKAPAIKPHAVSLSKKQPALHLDPGKEDIHLSFLKEHGLLVHGKMTVVIHPSASQPFKQWPVEHFIRLIDMMTTRFPDTLITILIGAGSDRSRLSGIQTQTSGKVHTLIDNPLERVMTLIKHATLFIGNDSGPKFLADGFNVPVIEIMGSLPPATAGVLNPESWSFYSGVSCGPCHQIQCKMDNKCLTSITPAPVFDRVLKMLSRKPYHGFTTIQDA